LTRSKFGTDQLDGAFISFPLSRFVLSADPTPWARVPGADTGASTSGSTIPTTAAISLAKQRREEMRKAGINPASRGDGFVSLDVGFANKGGESRLMREEDELGEGDEGAFSCFQGQLQLSAGSSRLMS
jgi:hypothetical protein